MTHGVIEMPNQPVPAADIGLPTEPAFTLTDVGRAYLLLEAIGAPSLNCRPTSPPNLRRSQVGRQMCEACALRKIREEEYEEATHLLQMLISNAHAEPNGRGGAIVQIEVSDVDMNWPTAWRKQRGHGRRGSRRA